MKNIPVLPLWVLRYEQTGLQNANLVKSTRLHFN
jgi:hypothetical protein